MMFPGATDLKTLIRPLIAAAVALIATPAFAQDANPGQQPTADQLTVDPLDTSRDTITVAIVGAYLPDYEGSDDYRFVPGAAVRGRVHGFNFFTSGTQLFVNVIPQTSGPGFNFELGPVAALNFNRTNRSDDSFVRNLGRRKLAFEAGGFLGISKTGLITSQYDTLTARVSMVNDVSGVNHSYVITPSISYGTPLSRQTYVSISASADYAGGRYAQTYFGVTPAESLRSGLPIYIGDNGWKDITFGALFNQSITGNLLHGLSLVATGSYSRLQGDFARSPLVRLRGDRNQFFGAVGLGYTF